MHRVTVLCTLSAIYIFFLFNRKRIICTTKLCNKRCRSPCLFKRKRAFISLSSLPCRGNLLRYVCARAHLRALTMQKSCAVGMPPSRSLSTVPAVTISSTTIEETVGLQGLVLIVRPQMERQRDYKALDLT